MTEPTDDPFVDTTLLEARAWLLRQLDNGARCPCCSQLAKIYRRKINSGMARSLIAMYRADPDLGWMHVPTVIGRQSAEEGKLAYWGLVEETTEPRADGGRAGWWRLTESGQAFVLGRSRVPKYARIYDGACLGFDATGTVTIRDALGTGFHYDDLMQGV